MLFIFAVIVYFLFYRISSSLFFGDSTDCFPCRRRTLLLLLKKPENPSNPHLIYQSGFDSGVISVTLYSFLMLIWCDQLFILITTVIIAVFCLRKTYLNKWPFYPCIALTCSCGMFRVIRTLNIFAQVMMRKKLHHTAIF